MGTILGYIPFRSSSSSEGVRKTSDYEISVIQAVRHKFKIKESNKNPKSSSI